MDPKTDAGIGSKERSSHAIHDIPSAAKSAAFQTPRADNVDLISVKQATDLVQQEERVQIPDLADQCQDEDDFRTASLIQETLKGMRALSFARDTGPLEVSGANEVPSLPTTPNLRAEMKDIDPELIEDQSSVGKDGKPSKPGANQVRIYKHHLLPESWRLYKRNMEADGVRNVVLSLEDWTNLMEENERLRESSRARDCHLDGARSPEPRQGRQITTSAHLVDTPLRSPRRTNSAMPPSVHTVPVPPQARPCPVASSRVMQGQPKGSPRGCARPSPDAKWPLQRTAQVASRWGITPGFHSGVHEEQHKLQHAVQAQPAMVGYPARSLSPPQQRATAIAISPAANHRRASPSPPPGGEAVTHAIVRQPSRSPSPGHHSSYCPCVMPKVIAPSHSSGVQAPPGGGARVRQPPMGSGVRSPLHPAPNVAWDRRVQSPQRTVPSTNRQA